MQQFIAALRASKPAQIPRLGIRLANGLINPRPPTQFWQYYVDKVLEPDVFGRLSPHSKCLLTCVACKLQTLEVKTSKSKSMVERVIRDVVTPRHIEMLNLELINMILVASYTIRVELNSKELQCILDRSHALMERECKFNIELVASLLHSLGALVRVYPQKREQIAKSEISRNFVSALQSLLPRLKTRELSLVIYALDKLKLINPVTAVPLVTRILSIREDVRGRDMATILFSCGAHPTLRPVLPALMDNVSAEMETMTGRMGSNICSAYIKANMWVKPLPEVLIKTLPKMNAQEMCNVVNLMLHKDVDVDSRFKDAYAKQLQALINTVKPSLLDALTITQSISCWDIAPNIDMESLDKVLQHAVNSTNVQFGPKHVYLLHYCHNLKCTKTSRTLANMVKRDLLDSLTNKELVVLHNALHSIGAEEKVVLNSVLGQRLKAGQCFSEIDLQTIVHWGNPKLCELVAQNYIGTQKRHSARSIRILAALLKTNTNHELTDAAIKQIELLKGTSTINIDHIVACCELLPYLQNEVDLVSIYNHAIQNVCSRIHDAQVDPKLVVTMLSIARKLNITSKELGTLANSITHEQLDPSAFLEYLNAVYHLELQVTDERKLLYQAERAINNTTNTRIKDSIVLTLAYLAFMGNLQYEVVQPLIAKQLDPGSSYMAIKAAYVSILGRTTGVLPPIFGRQKREHLAQPDTKLHTSIQATIAKVIGKTALNELTVALDYVTDILVTTDTR